MKSSTSHLSLLVVFAAASVAGFHSPTNDRILEVRFVDVTRTSGLHFQHRNSATPTKYLIETMTGGVAVLDFDNDGWLDVFFVNGARLKAPQPEGELLDKSAPEFWNRLFRNNHDGTFTDVTSKAGLQGKGYGMGAAVGDYNNDGVVGLFRQL